MFDYHYTMDSFGSECPKNWEEIADFLNGIIDNMDGIVDEFGELTQDGRDELDRLWIRYCSGNIPGAPAPIME